jgi:NnrS protein
MTTYPRWMNGTEIPAQRYVPAFILLTLGATGFYVGLFIGHDILPAAISITLLGWGVALYALLRVLLDTPPSDIRHPQIIFVALSLGWCGLAAFLIWLLSDNPSWLRIATQIGLWLFLLPVFASVTHRMIPFFTSSALPHLHVARPDWPWWVTIGIQRDAWPAATCRCTCLVMVMRYATSRRRILFDLRLEIAPHAAHPVARCAAHRLRLAGHRHAAIQRAKFRAVHWQRHWLDLGARTAARTGHRLFCHDTDRHGHARHARTFRPANESGYNDQ